MGAALAKYGGAAGASEQLEVLRAVAREIALVAAAAQVGCKAHVLGRAHLTCASCSRPNFGRSLVWFCHGDRY